ncbi:MULTISPECIES: type II toxin-antitoxin system VapC family toxin [Cyanophyceae]|uniref:type II toxin-antitoxin system VapC family toxin n=1 Tax=Cyanophyceae TaxID=3028117 RepID=UPI001682F670|nr:type II toxin-antitoxin system VapC family toxin [Trichocoleus sp. FACHB-69]MBD1933344.1 type II toxin-antitoxin system VapC family toxin [Trichocoleus sp. FACHB-69]
MTTPIKCVVDASVCIKQFVPDPLSTKAQQLFAHLANPLQEIYIPDLFYIESANTLWRYVRAGQLTATQVQANLATLKALSLRVVSTAELMEEAVNIAIAYGISAYDASYVALSHRVSSPLLTLDQRLVNTLATAPYDVRLFTDFSVPPLP